MRDFREKYKEINSYKILPSPKYNKTLLNNINLPLHHINLINQHIPKYHNSNKLSSISIKKYNKETNTSITGKLK